MNHLAPLLGHHEIRRRFTTAWRRNRLATTYLFVGPPGIGKRRFADWLAQAILCGRNAHPPAEHDSDVALEPCGVCRSCKLYMADSHPDLHVVTKPEDRSGILLEQLIGDREHRNKEGLCAELWLKPSLGARKVAIIDDADTLNEEGANSLLKLLEEPPVGSLLILVGTSEQKQLPTIRSRCQIIRFEPLSHADVRELLHRMGPEASEADCLRAVAQSGGSVEGALDWLDPELHELRDRMLAQLSGLEVTSEGLPKEIIAFVEAAGKETAAKRRRLHRLIDAAIDHYRGWMKGDSLATSSARPVSLPIERVVEALQTCMAAQAALTANANLPTLIETWFIELGQVLRGETRAEESFAIRV